MTENIITGRKFRVLIDEVKDIWLRISFWTKASDVECSDGENAETKFDNIKNSLMITQSTLAAGATSITISDSRITTNSALSFYTSIYGVNPTAVSVATGQVTLTFDSQSTAMTVGVRVDG